MASMNGQFVCVYRTLLKQLHRAAYERPHYLYELRFLLSRPLPYDAASAAAAAATAATASRHAAATTATTETTAAATACDDDDSKSSAAAAVRYLGRPASMCMSLDAHALYTACRRDVRNAIEGRDDDDDDKRNDGSDTTTTTLPPPLNAIATQMLRYRELLWLRDRLTRVLSETTWQRLHNMLRLAAGPNEDDFIPDELFDLSPAQSPAAAATSASTAYLTRDDEVHCAGAVGLQREVFVLRRIGDCALTRLVLRSGCYNNNNNNKNSNDNNNKSDDDDDEHAEATRTTTHLCRDALERCAHDHAALRSLVVECVPTTVTCDDAAVTLTARVRPFDEQYTRKEQGAHVGYFATAHRQFMLHVCVTAKPVAAVARRTHATDDSMDNKHNNNSSSSSTSSADGDDTAMTQVPMYVQVVNSYFARLDVVAGELMEEVGYLHSADVRRLLQERDLPGYSTLEGHASTTAASSSSSSAAAAATQTSEDDAENDVAAGEHPDDDDGDDDDDEHAARTGAQEQPSLSRSSSRDFALCFVNASDEPTVLKGLLYYKVGNTPDLQHAPIRALPFGLLRMQP